MCSTSNNHKQDIINSDWNQFRLTFSFDLIGIFCFCNFFIFSFFSLHRAVQSKCQLRFMSFDSIAKTFLHLNLRHINNGTIYIYMYMVTQTQSKSYLQLMELRVTLQVTGSITMTLNSNRDESISSICQCRSIDQESIFEEFSQHPKCCMAADISPENGERKYDFIVGLSDSFTGNTVIYE